MNQDRTILYIIFINSLFKIVVNKNVDLRSPFPTGLYQLFISKIPYPRVSHSHPLNSLDIKKGLNTVPCKDSNYAVNISYNKIQAKPFGANNINFGQNVTYQFRSIGAIDWQFCDRPWLLLLLFIRCL